MPESQPGIFLSYASQDAESAQRICEDLRSAGIQVWFDRSELRGGDAWDRQIRNQIHDCALFIPIISATTQGRSEGYFRREWKLAVDRTHDMSERLAFLVPVVIDDTADGQADVPEAFRSVQWTRLTGGQTTPAFVTRISQLLSPNEPRSSKQASLSTASAPYSRPAASGAVVPLRAKLVPLLIALTLATLGAGSLGLYRFMLSRRPVEAAFAPPLHSLAILPFVNMSSDKEQEYFSDGLTEELLNSLAEINGLQVAARTSAFSFKGKDVDIGTIARKLNVGAVLEGSVRRSEHTVRVTAQLINAQTGFHLWSKTYDRDLGDVLKLQTEIAAAVADALKVTLLGNTAAKIELGGTRNPAAFDAYLRGVKLARLAAATTPMDCRAPAETFNEAVALDSNYALAYAHRALLTEECANNSRGWLQQPTEQSARADAERAIALAPDLAEGYVALSRIEQGSLKIGAADVACGRALALSPSNDQVLYECSLLAAYLGHFDTAISGARHGVMLDPLNPLSHRALADTMRYARRYKEAIAAYDASIAADPEHAADAYGLRGISYYLTGDLSSAQSSCEASTHGFRGQVCLSMVYNRDGRHGDAAANLAMITKGGGDAAAYQYTEIYAQWGDREAALGWLEKALRLRDPGLIYTKTDPLLDPLRKEARFEAAERELKFPD
jgi:TolB-like protein